LLIEISSDEKGESSQFVPSESLSNLNLGIMIDRLEAQGRWKIDLPLNHLMGNSWSKAIEQRTKYLKSMRNIKLEDLM
jgi:membrane protein